MSTIAVYPGTFDPITNGHVDLIHRSLRIFNRVIVAIAFNPSKTPLFTMEERVEMAREATQRLQGVEVEAFDSLLVNYVRSKGAVAVIRGLRAYSDFEAEFQMALMNRRLDSQIETVFLMPSEEYAYVTSSIIRVVASFGGNIQGLVPKDVARRLLEKFQPKTPQEADG